MAQILRQAGHFLEGLLWGHKTLGLFGLILLEEAGIPLPVPGDVALILGGYWTSEGQINNLTVYGCVIGGAVIGSTILVTLCRRFGRPFVLRFGRFAGIDQPKLERAETTFQRWGPLAIVIGRLVPGLRIATTAVAGILRVPYRVFLPSVSISAMIWAMIFIELGRHLGPRALGLLRLLPTDLIPWAVLAVVATVASYLALKQKRQGAQSNSSKDA